MALSSVSFRVPASTSNLGPGFDTLGVALNLYNTITVAVNDHPLSSQPMIRDAAHLFFKEAAQGTISPFHFTVKITGDIPVSRGLGSSVTVRLGLLLGLAELARLEQSITTPIKEILDLVIALEGHPDNAVPSCLGGMAICSKLASEKFGFTRIEIEPTLSFVAMIPDLEMPTETARRLLPAQVPLRHAIENMQNTARISVSMASHRYEDLKGLFQDHLHQPYRQVMLPGFMEILKSATDAGALGCFLSGAGSTIMALSLDNEKTIAEAMQFAAQRHGLSSRTLVLHADNQGAQLITEC